MSSFCIKTNNNKIIDYLLNELNHTDIEEIYLSNKSFKIYENIIVHYKGLDIYSFHNFLSETLTSCIFEFYEKNLLKQIILSNYFYFSDSERLKILDLCTNYLECEENVETIVRKEHTNISLLKYISENKSVILDGFVNFRLQEYMKILDYVVDLCVNKYIIEKEYSEFISLLKVYIDSKKGETKRLHLIYSNGESIIIDDDKNIISTDDNIFNAKYLSDITFSSNDYALNTLLTIIPQEIIIHLVDQEDDFINTLKLIFSDRIYICRECSICNTYRLVNNNYCSDILKK